MGQLNRSSLISAGTNKAGKTNLSSLAEVWLNAWLRSIYTSWPWPFLQKRTTITSAGTNFSFGAGSVESLEISRIFDPIWVYDSTYTTQKRARIVRQHQPLPQLDETTNNPATNTGTPERFRIWASNTTWGQWRMWPTPTPDRTYKYAVDYQIVPADLTTDVAPLYPNDRTMIQAVFCDTLQYLDEERYQQELEVLAAMVREDRAKYGVVPGTNDQVPLDPNTFL